MPRLLMLSARLFTNNLLAYLITHPLVVQIWKTQQQTLRTTISVIMSRAWTYLADNHLSDNVASVDVP